ncbi:hypothetical protein ACFQ60_47220 [Streptomyces zhihengii]
MRPWLLSRFTEVTERLTAHAARVGRRPVATSSWATRWPARRRCWCTRRSLLW